MDNSDIHLAAIFAGVFIVAAMIGKLQQHPIDTGAIKASLSKFNQWVINGGALEASVFCALCGLLVAVLTWPWSY